MRMLLNLVSLGIDREQGEWKAALLEVVKPDGRRNALLMVGRRDDETTVSLFYNKNY